MYLPLLLSLLEGRPCKTQGDFLRNEAERRVFHQHRFVRQLRRVRRSQSAEFFVINQLRDLWVVAAHQTVRVAS